MVPHDINLSVALTGPNVTAGLTIRSLGHPSEGAYLALPQGPVTAAWNNGTDSAAYGVLRYLSLTAERYRTLVNPAYAGETPGWLKTLASTGHQVAKGAHHG